MNDQTPSRSQNHSSRRQSLPWRSAVCVLGCLSVTLWSVGLPANTSGKTKAPAASKAPANSQSQDMLLAVNTKNDSADDLDANESQIDDDAMDAQVDDATPAKTGRRRPGNAQRQQRAELNNEKSNGEKGNARRGGRAANATGLQEEDMPEALAVLHDYRPELVKRFQDWADRHPDNARMMLSRSVPMMTRLIQMRREDPAGYRLAIEDLRSYRFTTVLSKQLQQAKKDNDQERVEELSNKLRTLLTNHFEVRQKIREREIQKLQDRIDQLRKQMDRRVEKRDQILKLRFEQISNPDQ